MDQQNLPGTIRNEISVGDWMITLLISYIFPINIIMWLVWAFGGGTHPSKKNFALAALIWFAIGIVLIILFVIIFGAMFASMFSGMGSYS